MRVGGQPISASSTSEASAAVTILMFPFLDSLGELPSGYAGMSTLG